MEYTVDTILDKSIKICQIKSGGFRFGVDSVLLAHFSKSAKHNLVADIGSGSGVIACLIAKMWGNKVHAYELQEEVFKCLKKSIELSNLESIVTPFLQDARSLKKGAFYDVIVCNPPYRSVESGKIPESEIALISRFTTHFSVLELANCARSNLKQGGKLFFCLDADLLAYAMTSCEKFNLKPKRLQLLHKDISSKAKLAFVEAIYFGGEELTILPPLFQEGTLEETYNYRAIFNYFIDFHKKK